MARSLSRRLLPVVAAAFFMGGRGARLETQLLARTAAAAEGLSPSRRWGARAARRRLIPPAALLVARARGDADITEDVRWNIAETFANLDANGDDVLSDKEFLGGARRNLEERALSAEDFNGVMDVYRRLFVAADIDEDGYLNQREVEYSYHLANEAALRKRQSWSDITELAKSEAHLSKQKWQDLAKKRIQESEDDYMSDALDSNGQYGSADQDGDGRISYQEFLDLVGEAAVVFGWQEKGDDDPDVAAWMERLWAKADVSGDGYLSKKEFHFATYLLHGDIDSGVFIEKALVQEMFQEIDRNGDGRLDLREVAEAQKRNQARRAAQGDTADDLAGKATPLQRIRFYFDTADEDEDGYLDRAEATKLAARIVGDSM